MKDYSHAKSHNSGLKPVAGLVLINLDAVAVMPLFAIIFYPRLITLFILMVFVIIFWIASFKGYSNIVALRKVRTFIVGKNRYTQSPIRQRRRYTQ